MHSAISYELAMARIAELRRQAQRDTLSRSDARVPSSVPQPGRHQIPASLRWVGRQRRFGMQLWTLLHAQVLLDGPATLSHQRYLHAQATRLSDR